MAHQMAGNGDLTGQTAERTIAIADKYGFPPYRAGAGLLLVWAGDAGLAASAELVEEIAQAAAAGPNVQYLLGIAGELMLAAGRHDRAAAMLDRALGANEEPDVGLLSGRNLAPARRMPAGAGSRQQGRGLARLRNRPRGCAPAGRRHLRAARRRLARRSFRLTERVSSSMPLMTAVEDPPESTVTRLLAGTGHQERLRPPRLSGRSGFESGPLPPTIRLCKFLSPALSQV